MKRLLGGLAIICIMVISAYDKECCEGIYYDIVSTDYNLNETYIEEFYNISNFTLLIEEYPEKCQIPYNLDPLPLKPEYPKLIIYNEDKEDCNEVNSFFGLKMNLPGFLEMDIGSLECGSISKLKYFFEVEKEIKNYKVKAIRVWFFVFLILLATFMVFLIMNWRVNEEIEKYKNV